MGFSRCTCLLILFAASACSKSSAGADDVISDDAGRLASDAPSRPIPFNGGDFQLVVHGVSDHCLDGSLDLVFMPEGRDTPYPLKNRTLIPATAQLPKTYEMKLAAPFSNMQITMVAAGANAMRVRNALQKAVQLGLPGSKDCAADMSIDADVVIETSDAVSLSTTVTLTALHSATDTCPVVSVPCTASLVMTGTLP